MTVIRGNIDMSFFWFYIGGAVAAFLFQHESMPISERMLAAGVWPLAILAEIEWRLRK